jgi:hypothetical protein
MLNEIDRSIPDRRPPAASVSFLMRWRPPQLLAKVRPECCPKPASDHQDDFRKEERYRELLRCVRGFYEDVNDRTLKQAFIDEVNLCWLYCSDEVIRKANAFLNAVKGSDVDVDTERILGDFILAVRKDMLARTVATSTELTASEFNFFQQHEARPLRRSSMAAPDSGGCTSS